MRFAALLILVMVAGWAAPLAQVEAGGALESLTLQIAVDETLLEDSLREFRKLTLRRKEVATRVTQLQEALDAAVGDPDAAAAGRLDLLIEQVQRAAGERRSLFEQERVLLERISSARRRIALLSEKVETLEGRVADQRESGPLNGTWDVVLLPLEQRGSCRLKQEGAVVNGTYEFAGGWTGSLQGTLVERKVYLVRIDSRLGKMMEFEGYLSTDGRRMTGTWLNYELSGAEGSTGQWSAERRDQDRMP